MKTLKTAMAVIALIFAMNVSAQIISTTVPDNSTYPTVEDYQNVISQLEKSKTLMNAKDIFSYKRKENQIKNDLPMSLFSSSNGNNSLIIVKRNNSISALIGKVVKGQTTYFDIYNPKESLFSINKEGENYKVGSNNKSSRVSCAAAALAACQSDPECNLNCSLSGQLCAAAIVVACWFK